MSFLCWLRHRHLWQTLLPGILPWKLDGVHFCPRCDDGGKSDVVYVTPSGGAWAF